MTNKVSKPPPECAAPTAPMANLDLFRLAIDQGPDAVILADLEGRIRIWNNAAAERFGFGRDEAIGQSLDIIIPDHLRHAHWKGFGIAIVSGRTKYGKRALRTRAVHKTGRKLYVSLAFSIVKDGEGKVIGAMATARDLKENSDPMGPLPRSLKRNRAVSADASKPNSVVSPSGEGMTQDDGRACAAK